jgi:hypothetical protein
MTLSGAVYGRLRWRTGPYAQINLGAFARVSDVSPEQLDTAQQMASMGADRLKLLLAAPRSTPTQLTWPPKIYLTGVQWDLLVETMGEIQAAHDDAAANGFLPPPPPPAGLCDSGTVRGSSEGSQRCVDASAVCCCS